MLEKKNFREDVQKTPPLLKWAHVQIMPHNREEGAGANSLHHEEHEEREEGRESASLRGLGVLRGKNSFLGEGAKPMRKSEKCEKLVFATFGLELVVAQVLPTKTDGWHFSDFSKIFRGYTGGGGFSSGEWGAQSAEWEPPTQSCFCRRRGFGATGEWRK